MFGAVTCVVVRVSGCPRAVRGVRGFRAIPVGRPGWGEVSGGVGHPGISGDGAQFTGMPEWERTWGRAGRGRGWGAAVGDGVVARDGDVGVADVGAGRPAAGERGDEGLRVVALVVGAVGACHGHRSPMSPCRSRRCRGRWGSGGLMRHSLLGLRKSTHFMAAVVKTSRGRRRRTGRCRPASRRRGASLSCAAGRLCGCAHVEVATARGWGENALRVGVFMLLGWVGLAWVW